MADYLTPQLLQQRKPQSSIFIDIPGEAHDRACDLLCLDPEKPVRREAVKPSLEWVGRRQGRLTVEAFLGLRKFGRGKAAYFRFRCDCGSSFDAQKSNVIGRPRSDCGCSRTVIGIASAGASLHPLHKTWRHMLDRCANPNNKSFPDYGGRGIAVCDRWHT